MSVCGFCLILASILSVKCGSLFFNDVLHLGLVNHQSVLTGHSPLWKWMIHSQILDTVSQGYNISLDFLQMSEEMRLLQKMLHGQCTMITPTF